MESQMESGVSRKVVMCIVMSLVAAQAQAQVCYEPMRPTVVQLAGMNVGPQGDNGICTLDGQVVVSFAGAFTPGQTIRTTIPCTGPKFEGGLGSTMYDPERVESAAIMEIHFRSDGFISEDSVGTPLIFFRDAPTAEPERIPGICIVREDEAGEVTYIDPVTGEVVPAN